jgi:hypothetical protein
LLIASFIDRFVLHECLRKHPGGAAATGTTRRDILRTKLAKSALKSMTTTQEAEEAYLASSEKWNAEINFSEIDEDLAAFQEDELVQQALHRGVDLAKYGKELERDLRQVCISFYRPFPSSISEVPWMS